MPLRRGYVDPVQLVNAPKPELDMDGARKQPPVRSGHLAAAADAECVGFGSCVLYSGAVRKERWYLAG